MKIKASIKGCSKGDYIQWTNEIHEGIFAKEQLHGNVIKKYYLVRKTPLVLQNVQRIRSGHRSNKIICDGYLSSSRS